MMIMIVDHPVWAAIQQHVLKSLPEYAALGGLFLVAVIANMIHPDVFRNWLMKADPLYTKFKELIALLYEWFYNSLQAFMAARSGPRNAPVIVPPQASAVVTTAVTNGSTKPEVTVLPPPEH